MAKLVLKQQEQNPENCYAVVVVVYFEGTPTTEELQTACKDTDVGDDGDYQRVDNEVSKRAGLERWILWS